MVSPEERQRVSNIVGGEINPHSRIQFLQKAFASKTPAEVAGALETHYALDPKLGDVYASDFEGEFAATGLPIIDSAAHQRIADGRRHLATHLMDDYGSMLQGQRSTEHEYADLLRLRDDPNDTEINFALTARKGDRALEAYMQSKYGRRYLRALEPLATSGLYRSELLTTAYDAVRLEYFYEAEETEEDFPVEGFLQSDLQQLFGDQAVPADLTIRDVVDRRRELGLTDISKETLDKRFEMIVGAANITYGALGFKELRYLATLGGTRTERAQQLYAEYGKDLMGTDIHSKMALMQELAETYGDLAFYSRGRKNTAKAYQLTARRVAGLNECLESWMATFQKIYTNLGYEVPELVSDIVVSPEEPEEEPRTAGPTAVRTAVEIISETPTEPEALVESIEVSEDRIAVDGTVRHVAEQLLEQLTVSKLDKVILPADVHKFQEGLREEVAKTTRGGEGVQGEILEKVIDIATLCMNNGGELYRSKGGRIKPEDLAGLDLTEEQRTQLLKQQATPYFVAVFQLAGGGRAVFAERERYGFATIAVNEAEAGIHWHPALMRYRLGVQQPGVTRIIHSTKAPFGEAHQAKMQAQLDAMTAALLASEN